MYFSLTIKQAHLQYEFSARKMRKPPKRRVNSSATSRKNPILTLNSTLHYQNVSRIILLQQDTVQCVHAAFHTSTSNRKMCIQDTGSTYFHISLKFHRSKFNISSATSVSEWKTDDPKEQDAERGEEPRSWLNRVSLPRAQQDIPGVCFLEKQAKSTWVYYQISCSSQYSYFNLHSHPYPDSNTTLDSKSNPNTLTVLIAYSV